MADVLSVIFSKSLQFSCHEVVALFFRCKNHCSPIASGFVNDSRLWRTIQVVLVRKERFDSVSPVSVLKNYLKVDKRVEHIYTEFQAFRYLVALQT